MKRLACVLLLACVVACAPPASTVPLGVGPLALAELDANDAAARTRASSRAARPPPPRSADVAPSAKAASSDEDASAAAEEADGDESNDGDEATAAEASPSEAPAFDGLFAGEDVAVFRLSGFPEREQKDPKAQIRIKQDSESEVRITLINSENGSDLCELVARVEGNAALLESPQPCFSSEEEGAIQAELTSGRAVVDGDRLTMDAEGSLFVELADQEIPGTLEYSFKGRRQ